MSSKTYRLTQYTEYGQAFKVADRSVYILFRSNKKHKGLFVTDNEELQKAIESDKNFGKYFVLENETKVAEIAKEVAKTESESKEETASEEKKEETSELKAKNIQEANALCKKLFGKEAPTFRSSEKAIDYFKSKGYSLVFE